MVRTAIFSMVACNEGIVRLEEVIAIIACFSGTGTFAHPRRVQPMTEPPRGEVTPVAD